MHGRSITLNDANVLPALGVGLYKVPPPEVAPIVDASLELGFRLFDTATMYENEAALGAAIRAAGVARQDVFITTKVLNSDHGYDRTRDACRRSLDRLETDVIDLYLIHWPAPRQNAYVETWEALLSLQQEGLVRSIGVSNFHPHHLDRLELETSTVPVVNQIECHPWLPQNELHELHQERGIVTQGWSPLARGRILADSTLLHIARTHGVTTAEVALGWQLQRGIAVIPKTVRRDRLAQNARALRLKLSATEMSAVDALQTGERTGVDPDDRD